MPDLTRDEILQIQARAEAALAAWTEWQESDRTMMDEEVLETLPDFLEQDNPALAALALRQMEEIEAAQKLTADVRRWEPCGHYGRHDEAECQVCVNVSARGRLVSERDTLKAKLERVEALATWYDQEAERFILNPQLHHAYRKAATAIRAAAKGQSVCPPCEGTGYYQGARLSDEPCHVCGGTGDALRAQEGGQG